MRTNSNFVLCSFLLLYYFTFIMSVYDEDIVEVSKSVQNKTGEERVCVTRDIIHIGMRRNEHKFSIIK